MAQTNFLVSRKSICVLGLLSVLLLIQRGNAYQFQVGGPKGSWTLPSDPNAAIYNQWAEKNRFQIGDTLLFVYAPDHDSVLRVTKEDYENCNMGSPLEKFTDGHTVFSFNKSGAYYFISGVADNCHKNEKMHVVVMADRSKSSGSSPPSPSPKGTPPSPAPAGKEAPAPPPLLEFNPTPAPSHEAPPADHHNGAGSSFAGVVGTIAAFVGSSLVLAI